IGVFPRREICRDAVEAGRMHLTRWHVGKDAIGTGEDETRIAGDPRLPVVPVEAAPAETVVPRRIGNKIGVAGCSPVRESIVLSGIERRIGIAASIDVW